MHVFAPRAHAEGCDCLSFFEKILISTPWRFLSSKGVESDDGATWVEKPIPNNKQPLTDREFGGLGHV